MWLLQRNAVLSKINMKTLLAFLMSATIVLPAIAMRVKPAPPSGFSEGELEKLPATEARAKILEKLSNPDNEQYYAGLVHRLKTLGGVDVKDPVVVSALKEFVTKQLSREQAVAEATIQAISGSITIIGTRGASQDVPFLKDILLTKSKETKVSLQGDLGWGRERIRNAAIRALALTGDLEAEKTLREFRGKVKAEGADKYIHARIDREIEDNRKVRKHGVRKVLEPDKSK